MPIERELSNKPICPRCGNDAFGLEDWHHGLDAQGRMNHPCGFCGAMFRVEVLGATVLSTMNRTGDPAVLAYRTHRKRFKAVPLFTRLGIDRCRYGLQGGSM